MPPDVLASRIAREHAEEILRVERSALRRLSAIHEQARIELRGRLLSTGADRFTAQHLRSTLTQIESGIATLKARMAEEHTKLVRAVVPQAAQNTLAEIAYWEGVRQFAGGATGPVAIDALTRISATEALLLHRFQVSVDTYGLDVIGDIQRRLSVHVAMRSTWLSVADDVAGKVAQTPNPSVVAGSQWRAERIVRTELHHALNTGSQAALESAQAELPDLMRQWDATLDSRTSDVCRSLNGQVRALRDPWTWKGRPILQPPAIPNCRSRVIPWRRAWAEIDDSIEPEAKSRAPSVVSRAEIESTRSARAAAAAKAAADAAHKTQVSATAGAIERFMLAKAQGSGLSLSDQAKLARAVLDSEFVEDAAKAIGVDLAEILGSAETIVGAAEAEAKAAALARASKLVDDALSDYLASAVTSGKPLGQEAAEKLDTLWNAVAAREVAAGRTAEQAAKLAQKFADDATAGAQEMLEKAAAAKAEQIAAAKAAVDAATQALADGVGDSTAAVMAGSDELKDAVSAYVKLATPNATETEITAHYGNALLNAHAIAQRNVAKKKLADAKAALEAYKSASSPWQIEPALEKLASINLSSDEIVLAGGQADDEIIGVISSAKLQIAERDAVAKSVEALVTEPDGSGQLAYKSQAKLAAAHDALTKLIQSKSHVSAQFPSLLPVFVNAESATQKAANAIAEKVAEFSAKVAEIKKKIEESSLATGIVDTAQEDTLALWIKGVKLFAIDESNAVAIANATEDAAEEAAQFVELVKAKAAQAKAEKLAAEAQAKAAEEAAKAWPATQSGGAPQTITLPTGEAARLVKGSSGSNPGGFYRTDGGAEWFVKFPGSTGQIPAERFCGDLAKAIGLPSKDYVAFATGSRYAIASRKIAIQEVGAQGLASWSSDELTDHFVHAVLTGDWDVVGLGFDNLVRTADGKLLTVDYGGSLLWRAQGALKPSGAFHGGLPGELDTLRSASMNPQAAAVFGKLSDEQIAKRIRATLGKLDDAEIESLVNAAGFAEADRKKIADALVGRRKALLKWADEKLPSGGGISGSDLVGGLPVNPDYVLVFTNPTPGASSYASADSLRAIYRQAVVDGDAAAQAKMGRRLWAGTPILKSDRKLSLRFLAAAHNANPKAVEAELAAWKDMAPVLDALKAHAKHGDVDAILAAVEASEKAAQAAVEKAAKEAAEKAAQAAAAAKAKHAEAIAAHQAEVDAYNAKIKKLKLPNATTSKGELTEAYRKRLAAWQSAIESRQIASTQEQRLKIAEIAVRLDGAKQRLEALRSAHARRSSIAAAKARVAGTEAELRREIESVLVAAGVLPRPPTPPRLSGLGIPRPRFRRTSHHASEATWKSELAQATAEHGRTWTVSERIGTFGGDQEVDFEGIDPGAYDEDEALRAIRAFTASTYRKIRVAKRGRLKYPDSPSRTVEAADLPHYKRMADLIDETIQRMGGFEATSGLGYIVRREAIKPDKIADFIEYLHQNPTISFKSPTSFSTREVWSGSLTYRIRGHTSGLPVRVVSSNRGEDEVLIASHAVFKVERVTESGHDVIVDLVEVFAGE